MSIATETPRVYIACLASYNAGRGIGRWADATDVDEMNEAQKQVAETAWKTAVDCGDAPVYFGYPEEFAIHDYDGFPGNIVSKLGEYPQYKTVAAIGKLIDDHGDMARNWLSWTECDLDEDDLEERMQSQYCGSAESEEDYAREYVSDTGGWEGVPSVVEIESGWQRKKINIFEELENYIDWESIAQALFDHGTMALINGDVFDSEK